MMLFLASLRKKTSEGCLARYISVWPRTGEDGPPADYRNRSDRDPSSWDDSLNRIHRGIVAPSAMVMETHAPCRWTTEAVAQFPLTAS